MKQVIPLWRLAGLFLLVATSIGVLMRFQFISSTGFNYQYLLHTHSHIVLLGWVFNAILAAIHFALLRDEPARKYVVLYMLFQVSVLGMLFSFPVQGYGLISILFSTLHIFLSYAWVLMIWKRTLAMDLLSGSMLRWGLFYLVVATLGPFALAFINASGNAGSDMYFMAIYFYLHFLYNGAFIFIAFGLLFWGLKEKGLEVKQASALVFVRLMNVSCIVGVQLSALWMKPDAIVYWIAAFAAMVQMGALAVLVKLIRPIWDQILKTLSRNAQVLFALVAVAFVLKVCLQAVSAHPAAADLAYEVRNYAIGYLHLVFLGVLTPFIFVWFNMMGLISFDGRSKTIGVILYLLGFLLTETIIISQTQWGASWYYEFLFGASLLLWVGIALLVFSHEADTEELMAA